MRSHMSRTRFALGTGLLLTLALAGPALGWTLDTQGTAPTVDSCPAPGLVKHGFQQCQHVYHFKGSCQASSSDEAKTLPYEIKAVWNADTKTAIGQITFTDWYGKPAKVSVDAGPCTDDPWLHHLSCPLKGLGDPQGWSQKYPNILGAPYPKMLSAIPAGQLPALVAEAKAAPPCLS